MGEIMNLNRYSLNLNAVFLVFLFLSYFKLFRLKNGLFIFGVIGLICSLYISFNPIAEIFSEYFINRNQ